MSLMQGSRMKMKNSHNGRFIIKSKTPMKENSLSTQEAQENVHASQKDIHLFLSYMANKSKRWQELIKSKSINNQEEFMEHHLYGSAPIKTILQAVLDKMLTERRLGKHLKGMNKLNLFEIQNTIWTTLEREVLLFQNSQLYHQQKLELQTTLANRKREILAELQNLKRQRCSFEEDEETFTGDKTYSNSAHTTSK